MWKGSEEMDPGFEASNMANKEGRLVGVAERTYQLYDRITVARAWRHVRRLHGTVANRKCFRSATRLMGGTESTSDESKQWTPSEFCIGQVGRDVRVLKSTNGREEWRTGRVRRDVRVMYISIVSSSVPQDPPAMVYLIFHSTFAAAQHFPDEGIARGPSAAHYAVRRIRRVRNKFSAQLYHHSVAVRDSLYRHHAVLELIWAHYLRTRLSVNETQKHNRHSGNALRCAATYAPW